MIARLRASLIIVFGLSVFIYGGLTAEAGNLIYNPGFEFGSLSGWSTKVWTGSPTVSVDTSVYHSGEKSLKITSGASACVELLSAGVTLTAGHRYRISAWVKTDGLVTDGTGTYLDGATCAFRNGNPPDGWWSDGVQQAIKGTNGWTLESRTFTWTPYTGSFYLAVSYTGWSSGTGTVWFDDVVLEDITSTNLILNPGFESVDGSNHPTYWSGPYVWGVGSYYSGSGFEISVDSTASHSGGKSLKMYQTTAYTTEFSSNAMYLTSGRRYRVSGWIKTDNLVTGGSGGYLDGATIAFRSGYPPGAGWCDGVQQAIKGTNDWTFFTRTFTWYWYTGNAYLIASHNAWSPGTGTVWLDDISVEELPNLVSNPGFESIDGYNHPTDWSGPWIWDYTPGNSYSGPNVSISVDSTVAYSGGKSLKIQSTAPQFDNSYYMDFSSNPMALSAGRRYRVSGWVKTDNLVTNGSGGSLDGTTYAFRNGYPSGAWWGDGVQQALKGTNGWTYLSRSFPWSSANGVYNLIASYSAWSKGTGTTWFDDASIEELLKTSVLFLYDQNSRNVSDPIETQYRQELQNAGYEIGRCKYADLTSDVIKQYNVVVMDWAPLNSYTTEYNAFTSKLPLIRDFVSQGGGVLVLYEADYDATYQGLNEFLSPYGASIINEGVTDPSNLYHQAGYLSWYYARTDNMVSHPITSGVSNVWYPIGNNATIGRNTSTMSVDGNWQVIVRGESTAYSYNDTTQASTYTTAPPILAVRSAGMAGGRIAIFPSHSTFTSTSGHHDAIQETVWSRGNGTTASDVYTMFINMYDWLAGSSLDNGCVGGYAAPADPPEQELQCPTLQTRGLVSGTPYKVLVGAHSAYSDGTGTVQQWVSAAKAAGYSVLVFAEKLDNSAGYGLTEAEWNQEKADCAYYSDSTFKAVAGVDYLDTNGSGERRITFGLQQWFVDSAHNPPQWDYLDATRTKVAQDSGVLFGNNWPGLVLTNPTTNAFDPWYAKFYKEFGVYTYSQNTLEEDSFDIYLEMARDCYDQIPYVVRRMYSPSEISGASGYDLYTKATSVDDAYAKIKTIGDDRVANYVSNGPTITDWYIDNSWQAPTDCGGTAGNQWTLHISVSASAGFSEVVIYDGTQIFRRFKPSGTSFATTVTGAHDKQHSFVLVVRDSQGKQAIGAEHDTNSREYADYMCIDMQNTLNSANVPNENNTKLLTYDIMGAYVTGWDSAKMGVPVNFDDIMPKGLDYAFSGFTFCTSHYLNLNTGASESGLPRRTFYHGARDCCVLRNIYTDRLDQYGTSIIPTDYADTTVDYTFYNIPERGLNIMRLDYTTVFKQACTLGNLAGLESGLLRIGLPSDSMLSWAYTNADGSKTTGTRTPTGMNVSPTTLQNNGYVALYPDFYGGCAVYSLQTGLHFSIANNVLEVGFETPSQYIPSGAFWVDSLLLVRDIYGNSDLSNFDLIRSYFGASGTPAFNPVMSRGTLVSSTFYPLELAAYLYSAQLTTSAAAFPDDLPVMVSGLNGKWDAGLYDVNTQTLKPIGVTDGHGYTRFSTATARDMWIGNLVTANNADVWVQLVDLNWQNRVVRVHNPTDSTIVTTVTGLLPPIYGRVATVTVPAGSTVTATLQ